MAKQDDESDRADAPSPAGPDDDAQPTKVIEPVDPDAQPTEVLGFREPPRPEAPARRGISRTARVWITITAIVVGLIAVVVVVDVVARGLAEQRVAAEIRSNLPEGVEGDVDVSIGGFSVIAQYLSGTVDQVTLTAPELTVDGAPLDVTMVAQGVPVDLASPVRELDAVIEADEDSINQLVSVAGIDSGVTLGDGTVGYDGEVDLLGFQVSYSVTAQPTAAGDSVLLEPVNVEVGAGGSVIDVSGIIERLGIGDPFTVCIADRLPQGLELDAITVTPGVARVELSGQDIALDSASLQQTGSCE